MIYVYDIFTVCGIHDVGRTITLLPNHIFFGGINFPFPVVSGLEGRVGQPTIRVRDLAATGGTRERR